jgi:tartrate-resistant acid phosphatase type 5
MLGVKAATALFSVLLLASCDGSDTGGKPPADPPADAGGDAGEGSDAGPGDGPVRFIVLGDAGTGNADQLKVAAAIAEVCAARGCDFALYAGDNIYDSGVSGVDDAQFDTKFEQPYAELDFPFYVALGNHDYGNLGTNISLRESNDAQAHAQVEYTARSDKWNMPSEYYTFRQGPAAFFAIDSNALVVNLFRPLAEQAAWLDAELAKSDAPWKIVFGHHPYLSNGRHGNATDPGMVELIEGSVCGKAAVYFSGHDHDREWLEPTCGTHFVVSGAGGRGLYTLRGEEQPTRWQDDSEHGFLWVEIAGETLTGVFYDADGNADYEDAITL